MGEKFPLEVKGARKIERAGGVLFLPIVGRSQKKEEEENGKKDGVSTWKRGAADAGLGGAWTEGISIGGGGG